MSRDGANEAFVRRVQDRLGLRVDGWAGPNTEAAFDRLLESRSPIRRSRWPAPDERSLTDFYGSPGSANLVSFELPYPMRLAWDLSVTVEVARAHRLVVDSLRRCLAGIAEEYGPARRVELGLDLFGGIYSYRRQRGGKALSTHAWGIAIDLNPEANGFRTPWPGVATMPERVVEIFEAEGWLSGARAWRRDAMHFQATKV